MNSEVFMAVLLAALLHAIWNALVKGGADKQLNMISVMLGHVPLALIIVPFVPIPSVESWWYLLAGIFLHTGYQLFLIRAYQSGDLTQVYPIARGSAPLMIAIFSVLVLGVVLSAMELAAVCLIAIGIMSICLSRQSDGAENRQAAVLALITGGFIASYSLVDGLGARLAGTALGFYCWLTFGNALLILLIARLLRIGLLTDMVRYNKKIFFFGGTASFVAYAIATWAFTQAPIALVTALRETSIVFALLLGVFYLKEKISLLKILSIMVTLSGVVLLRFSR